MLAVRDDGERIRPHEDRQTALRYIATHIGRSHKRNLSPRERQRIASSSVWLCADTRPPRRTSLFQEACATEEAMERRDGLLMLLTTVPARTSARAELGS